MNDLTVGAIIDGKRIATLQVEASSDMVLDTLEDAGRYIYAQRWQVFTEDDEPVLVEWSDLITAQQLNVLYQELIYVMREMAGSYHINAAADAARDAAEAEVGDKYL